MWERMWKPSQSGNPAGVGKAYLEAMGEGSTQTQVSPSTEPARRWRWRKQLDLIVITFNVSPHLTDKLVRLGGSMRLSAPAKRRTALLWVEPALSA